MHIQGVMHTTKHYSPCLSARIRVFGVLYIPYGGIFLQNVKSIFWPSFQILLNEPTWLEKLHTEYEPKNDWLKSRGSSEGVRDLLCSWE